jgi:two-component sensor histidine kinase
MAQDEIDPQEATYAQRSTLIAREMQHRVRNIIAVLQAIVRQTLRNAATKEQAEKFIADRLSALARLNDLFIQENTGAVSLHTVVRSMLDIYDDASSRRFRIDGPDVFLDQRLGLGLALILHEMATNASKYGALSNNCGHVELRWEVSNRLHLQWVECDGPPIDEPSHKGFGTRLIQDVLRGTGTSVKLSFPRTGVTLHLEIQLPDLQPPKYGSRAANVADVS